MVGRLKIILKSSFLTSSGIGIEENVAILYYAICKYWQPGGTIFLFGFSRGGYTVRILASLVADFGVVHFDSFKKSGKVVRKRQYPGCLMVVQKWVQYKDHANPKRDSANLLKCHFTDAPSIEVVRVWDTVTSVGIPDMFAWKKLTEKFKFAAKDIRPKIQNAFQANLVPWTSHCSWRRLQRQ